MVTATNETTEIFQIPHNKNAEQALIATLILDNSLMDEANSLLTPADFYIKSNRAIYEAMVHLHENGSAIDPVLLERELTRTKQLEVVGGMAYIASLLDGAVRTTNLEHYAKILREETRYRELLRLSGQIRAGVLTRKKDAQSLCLEYEQQIAGIYNDPHQQWFVSSAEIVNQEVERMERVATGEALRGLSTGFSVLDNLLCGLLPGQLITLGAGTGMGKTALAITLARHAAKAEKVVAFFSLEMTKEEITNRMLISEAKVKGHKIRAGFISRTDWAAIASALQVINDHPIFIDDTGAITVSQLRAKARRLKGQKGLHLLVVDYLQLVSNPNKNLNREQQVSEISRQLKALAKELDIPILALSQLNRDVDRRADHRPQLSDLRESGAVAQDSDVVLFIYREEITNPKPENQGVAEIIVAKQRSGPPDSVKVAFLDYCVSFEPLWRKN